MSNPVPNFNDIMLVTRDINPSAAIHDTEAWMIYQCCTQVPKDGLVVEVGCQMGRSSSIIIQMAQAIGFHNVHIDPYTEQPTWLNEWTQMAYRVGGAWEHAFTLLCMRTEQADWHLSKFGEIDVAFIDGDHESNSVEVDMKLVAERIKEGGVLLAHDYACETWSGVKKAIDAYITPAKWESLGLFHTVGAWRRK